MAQEPAAERAPETRAARVAAYAVFIGLIAVFVALLIRSVAMDLYGRPPRRAARSDAAAACLGDIERLYRALQARIAAAAHPGTERQWHEFDTWSRRWDEDLDLVSARCHLDEEGGEEEPARAALATAAERLEDLRRHVARCGDEGIEVGRLAREAIEAARAAVRRQPGAGGR